MSVLFVDLVDSTALGEGRDAEDVRELMSGYFGLARTAVARHGGVVEKFIGDAVMAVWGSPVAQEDDAERAVRAALEIVEAVAGYGEQHGLPLRARAGVVTGEVATWASAGEGLVVGDRVNTAARVQSAAEPGSVYVDELTKRATQAAIAYTDAGEHAVKGKAEPLRLWRAERVVAGAGGAQRMDGLEARFLGRARELALVKELFHATVEGGRARLVAISGVAGVGKSRLGWEFEKYVDGIAATVWWHRGRCLSYGDGVAYWALAEMVRQRLGIAEEDPPEVAAGKLAAGLPRWVPDAGERDFLTPRLGALVAAVEGQGLSREELFAGWRLFLERLAASQPVVMVIEDLHWADAGLLDFVEYLLDWSATAPIFLLTLARPELAERRPGWLADARNATRVHLDPLPEEVMDQLLDELVPGMPQQTKARIVARAEGVPLYAVETIRALIDRDVVVPREGVYRLIADVGELDVPATLAALIAARLDALATDERELVKDLAVLGGSFPRAAVAAVSNAPAEAVDKLLRGLVRKEVLTVRSDPLSPERGQYAFVQTLLRTVAHDRLTKRERKTRHLAVAARLRGAFPDDGEEVAEVIAAHYHDAYTAARTDPDADTIRTHAVAAFERAGRRAGAIGAPDAAEKAYRTAADLAASEPDTTRLTEAAAQMALRAGRYDDALTLFDTAAAAHTNAGRHHDAARLAAPTGRCLLNLGRAEEGVTRMRAALAELDEDNPEAALATLHVGLGAALLFTGHPADAGNHLEKALALAAALELPDVLAHALTIKAGSLDDAGRNREALAAIMLAVGVAREHGLTDPECNALINLADLRMQSDLAAAAADAAAGAIALSRRLGDRSAEGFGLGELALNNFFTGRWGEAEQAALEGVQVAPDDKTATWCRTRLVLLHTARGDHSQARDHVNALAPLAVSDDVQDRVAARTAEATLALAEGRVTAAFTVAEDATREARGALGLRTESFRLAWPLALDAALAADRLDEADDLLALVADAPKGHIPPYLRAQLSRYRALLTAACGSDHNVEKDLIDAIAILRQLDYPYHLAQVQADLGRWLHTQGRATEAVPILTEAADMFRQLGAKPALAATIPLLTGVLQ